MNHEDCVRIKINDSVADVLDRLSYLSADDRWALLMEHIEVVATEINMDAVLMVPDFSREGFSMTDKNIGGLSDYIVLKKVKEVVFYLHNPYPDCLEIPAIMKQRFPDDYKSIVTCSLEEFKKYRGQV